VDAAFGFRVVGVGAAHRGIAIFRREHAFHPFYVYSYAFQKYSDVIELYPDQEVYRRDIGMGGVARTSYVVYVLKW
jgi:hypothetical protein